MAKAVRMAVEAARYIRSGIMRWTVEPESDITVLWFMAAQPSDAQRNCGARDQT